MPSHLSPGTAASPSASTAVPSPQGAGCTGRRQARPPQPLNQEVIVDATNVQRGRGESLESFNSKLTHLQLQGRRLGPDLRRLDLVQQVYVLYAYDNLISSLAGIEHAKRLQMLYLQNNRLTSMAGLEGLTHLKKLHLGHNRLVRIEHLDHCANLEELYVPHQRPPASEVPLEFCPTSMAAIAGRLRVLDAAGNRLEDCWNLSPLKRLVSFDLCDNAFQQVADLRELLMGPFLTKVSLTGNPFESQNRKATYRTAVVLGSQSIEEIDGRPVLAQERDFVKRLDEQKRKLKAQRSRLANRGYAEGGAGAAAPVSKDKVYEPGDRKGPGRIFAPPVIQDLVQW